LGHKELLLVGKIKPKQKKEVFGSFFGCIDKDFFIEYSGRKTFTFFSRGQREDENEITKFKYQNFLNQNDQPPLQKKSVGREVQNICVCKKYNRASNPLSHKIKLLFGQMVGLTCFYA
jgi:hypothetical protein